MGCLKESLGSFLNNRWLVFVAAMWIQSCAGIGYLFGSISPTIKASLNYNQRQVASLGVAKDLGDCVGFLAGTLSEILPLWAALLVGAIQNFVGYGWVWLVVTGRTTVLPLWAMCVLIFIGTNGETYFNTASLVSCVQNFPKSRGPVVGILKGFAGLSGAILTQVYMLIHSPDPASLISMVAVGPTIIVISLMFIIRPISSPNQNKTSDTLGFSIIFSICLVLAAYLMGVMLLQDLLDLSTTLITLFTIILIVILMIPILIPIAFSSSSLEEELLADEDMVLCLEKQKRINVEATVMMKGRPRRGEDFNLSEALVKADFWLIFFSLLLGSGSGLTVIDNLGQMSQSLGYINTHVFVSMISVWNFLGRVGGGYISEKIVGYVCIVRPFLCYNLTEINLNRDYAYPRPIALAAAQVIMAIGHFFFAMGWPGAMYIGTLLVGIGYGSHWAIVPATASELFGLKKFGSIYNFLTLANPAGSLVFSGLIASSIYDREAEKQGHGRHRNFLSSFTSADDDDPLVCKGSVCFFLTSMIMSGFCIIAVVLSLILVHRTKRVYANLYGGPQR